jgi:O-antigen/teichoic acid export membrane protein
MSAIARESSLARQMLHLGVSKFSLLGGRVALFLCFGFRLTPEAYGEIALLFALGTLGVLALEFGVSMVLLRQSAKDKAEVSSALGGIFFLRLFFFLPALFVYTQAAIFLLGQASHAFLALVVGVYFFSYQMNQNLFGFLQGIHQTKVESRFSVALHTSELGLILLWWWCGDSLLLLMFALAGCRVFSAICLFFYVFFRFHLPLRWDATKAFLAQYWKDMAAFYIFSFFQFIYVQSDIFLLKWLRTTEEVGHYWACYRLMLTFLLPLDVLIQAMLPRLARADTKEVKVKLFQKMHTLGIFYLTLILFFSLAYPGFFVHRLLGEQFSTLVWLWFVIALALGSAYLPPFGLALMAEARFYDLGLTFVITACTNVALNLLWIPKWGAYGAAAATALSYVWMKLFLAWILWRRGLPLLPPVSFLLLAVGGLLLLFLRLFQGSLYANIGGCAVFVLFLLLFFFRTFSTLDETKP